MLLSDFDVHVRIGKLTVWTYLYNYLCFNYFFYHMHVFLCLSAYAKRKNITCIFFPKIVWIYSFKHRKEF